MTDVLGPAFQPATAAPPRTDTPQKAMIGSDFETFLRMLTTQIRNQDPLNPMQASDFAVQLATFAGVEQQVRSNELLEGLGRQMAITGLAQLAGWVGMQARVAAPVQFAGDPVELYVQPPAYADRAVLVVRNAFGTEVDRRDIPLQPGPLIWNGRGSTGMPLPEGAYSFEVVGFSNGSPVSAAPVESYARIAEARMAGGEVRLLLEGGVEVAASAVTALRS
jgi:flagellar basal-body rod modification protein FlgD